MSNAPDYKANDPKGWCGDPSRGAAMGRRDIHDHDDEQPIALYLRRVRLDEGGYDVNGTYFGSGDPLFWYADADGTVDAMLRAKDRGHAIEEVRLRYPRATFVGESIRQEITDACAWMLWAQAWISHQEELGDEGVNPGAGGSWDAYVPEVPDAVTKGAQALIASVERMNGATIDELYTRVLATVPTNKRGTSSNPERFGTLLGYQAAGAGIGVRDDFPHARIKVPEVSVYAYSDTGADVGNVDERFAK